MNNLSYSGSLPEREYVNLMLKELNYCRHSRKGHEKNSFVASLVKKFTTLYNGIFKSSYQNTGSLHIRCYKFSKIKQCLKLMLKWRHRSSPLRPVAGAQ